MRTILVTVGTSLLGNIKRDCNLAQPDEQQIANYLRHTEPEKASAETNSLSRLLQEKDTITFIHSQTPAGEQCATALQKHYKGKGFSGSLHRVKYLTYSENSFKMRGLRSLVAALIELIRNGQRQEYQVLINATGGFKAEIAYATLVGLLFDVPVYYIHEAFRDVIEMPPTPISWDYSLIADYEEFFEWLSEDYHTMEETEQRLARTASPQQIRLLLADEDGYTFLSPAGEAFFEAYRQHIMYPYPPGTSILLSSEAQRTYNRADAATQALFDRALRKLGSSTLRNSGSGQVSNCNCLTYPKGHRNERVFWYEEGDKSVHVCELALHSDGTYDRLIDRGVRREEYAEFVPVDVSS